MKKNQKRFDATVLTQKILSCITRLQQHFGLNYVTSVLQGSKAKYILGNNHQTLLTYGIITEYSKDQLKDLIRQLATIGYLIIANNRFSTLTLTTKSIAVLKGKEKVFLKHPPTWFEIMKQKAVNNHISLEATISLLHSGFNIEQIAKKRRVTPQTVIKHIYLAAFLSIPLNISRLFEENKINIIEKAFEEVGIERLTPVKVKLGDKFSYDELRLVRAMLIAKKISNKNL